ncbi:MAG: hypothetical protein GTO18_19350 [Anaerolineales bacterium]|nr:hypothetical protein [Anaerolineales bacterium]
MSEEVKFSLDEAHLEFAKKTNGEVWALLEKTDRTADEDEAMEYAAYTSLYHWLRVGTEVNHQRGEWMLAHVYTILGRDELALKHAYRCLNLTEANKGQMEDFDIAYAYEGVARAEALVGNQSEAVKYRQMAIEAGEAVEDEESRNIFTADLEGGDWYGVS